jgi:DNA-binding CsgD family transcriptional regulator
MNENRLYELIGEIYERCLDPARASDVGRTIEHALGIDSSIHFISERSSGKIVRLLSASDNFDSDARCDYAAYYHDRNIWFRRALPHPVPFLQRGEELIAESDFLRTEFCADWCSRVDIFHMIGCTYFLPDGMVGGSGVHRTRRQGAFDDADKQLYKILMEHFARAVQLSLRLDISARQAAIAPEIVEALDLGVILVNADRRVLQANRIAEAVLARRQWLTVVDGRLRTIHHGSLGLLSWRIAEAARTGTGGGLDPGTVLRLRASGGDALPILIAPFRVANGAWGTRQPTAALLFRDPDNTALPKASQIAAVYGLSPAEGRLVALLVTGKSLTEAARCAGISLNTAKTQLKSVFARTDFTRQTDLVAEIRANPLLRVRAQLE